MRPIISFRGITKSFGSKTVINHLDLDIHHGDILGLIGKSGCGKSTLIKVFTGFYNVNSGKIYFKGKDVTNEYRDLDAVGHVKRPGGKVKSLFDASG